MILHLYFARRFAITFGLVTAAFALILFLVSLVEQIRRFEGDPVSFPGLMGLSLLTLPQTLYMLLPLLAIIATVTLFLALSRSSELVVTRASGRSALRSLAAPVAVSMVIGAVAVAALNPIVAITSTQYDVAADRASGGEAAALSVGPDGLWLRSGDGSSQTVIHADRADADGTALFGVTFIGFDQSGTLRYRIEAETARLSDGVWLIEDAKDWRFDAPNPERAARTFAETELATPLTAEQILDSFADPAAVSIWGLPRFIRRVETAGFSGTRHRVWLQMELATPLLLAAMTIVGAAFTMRHTRFGRTGLMVLMALLMGFSLFFIRNFAQILGENGQIPILLAAWGPPVAAFLLPLGLLLHWEDG